MPMVSISYEGHCYLGVEHHLCLCAVPVMIAVGPEVRTRNYVNHITADAFPHSIAKLLDSSTQLTDANISNVS